jgi:hypothetical protein
VTKLKTRRGHDSMTDEQAFEIGEYPKDGRLVKYEKELLVLLKGQDNEGIIAFSERIFQDCIEYLRTTLAFFIVGSC